jgi:serine O-acetyltransferase
MKTLMEDLAAASHQTPTLGRLFRRWFSDTGFKAVLLHRAAHWLYRRKVPYRPALLAAYSVGCAGSDIRPEATIGPGLVIKHSPGIVVGGGVVAGRRLTLLQNVTLGEKLGKDGGHEYPHIGDDVTIAAGAVLLGRIVVGNGAVVGANAVVISDVEPFSVVGGVPARRLK